MALSQPTQIFGLHQVTPYSRTTGKPFGTGKVLGTLNLALTGELVESFGGSNKFAFAVEEGVISSEITLAIKEYPDFLFELFVGKAPTVTAAEASGSITTLTNKKGTSAVSATVGMASIAITTAADAKFGEYTVEVITSTTVDVFISTDIDAKRGTDLVIQNDLLKITASALTVPGTDGTVVIPNTGLTITGGSGSVSMTIGDTATFKVKPINDGSTDVIIGASGDTNQEFGLIAMAQKRSDGQMVEFNFFRCKGSGMPVPLEEKVWAQSEINIRAFQDATLDGVFSYREVAPSTFN